MLSLKAKPSIIQLQWIIWVFVFLILMFSLVSMDGYSRAATYAAINTVFYATIIYVHILVLYPRFYQTGRYVWYVLLVTALLGITGVARACLTMYTYNTFFTKKAIPMNYEAMRSYVVAGILIFLLSFIFRIAIEYFKLKQQTEEIITQRARAELDLLKSQVQPHFLFNTLNNIYYEAYLESPRTAGLIERLSNIMRYFVDESPKQEVSLGAEIQFLENYIALEQIRIRYDIDITFTKNCDNNANIPPMLLMTFVENIFKHGIDKSSNANKVQLSLIQQNGRLIFTTINTIPGHPVNVTSTGFGIANLRKRLVLLYDTDFEMATQVNGQLFTASLNIPLA